MLAAKKHSGNSYLMWMKEERRDTSAKDHKRFKRRDHNKNSRDHSKMKEGRGRGYVLKT